MSRAQEKKIFARALDCVRCGSCRVIYADRIQSMRFGTQCPPGSYYKIESFTPAGRMYTAVGLMREKFPYSERAVESVYTCTQCGYCQAICEEYVETQTMSVIEALRNKAVRDGAGPPPGHKKSIENFQQFGNIYGQPKQKRFEWLHDFGGTVKDFSKGARASVLFFVGSHYAFHKHTEHIPRAVAEIITKSGVDWGILGEAEGCSGYHALALGYREVFEQTARKNIETFNRLGVRQIIVSCPEDYTTLKLRYPEIAPLNAEVWHTTAFFQSLIKKGKLSLQEQKLKVTYHDPCHLGRYDHQYETPRDVIRSIPGIELVEMERNRMDAWCCGAGGGVKLGYQTYAVACAIERMAEAAASGAEVLVTACPLCIENFHEAKTAGNLVMEIQDLATLLHRSLAA